MRKKHTATSNRYLKFYYLLEYDNGINKRKLIVNLKKKKKKSNKGKKGNLKRPSNNIAYNLFLGNYISKRTI